MTKLLKDLNKAQQIYRRDRKADNPFIEALEMRINEGKYPKEEVDAMVIAKRIFKGTLQGYYVVLD